MRDGVSTLLAGHFDAGWRTRVPILALKGTFHALSLARRLGLRDVAPVPLAGA
jgi:hypothetical protein